MYSPFRIKPQFMVIGVQKGGTTSLFHYLSEHKDIVPPNQKELHFFDIGFTKNSLFNYSKKFTLKTSKKVSFDATPNYIYHPGTENRLFDFNPKLKLIIVLRDPVLRAYSAWNMYRQMIVENKAIKQFETISLEDEQMKIYDFFCIDKFPSFEEWCKIEMNSDFDNNIIEPSIVRRGYYVDQINRYLSYFPRNQLLFINSESLKKDTLRTLNSITNFLGLEEFDLKKDSFKEHHSRNYEAPIKKEFYNKLQLHYIEKNEGLSELTGLNFSWMSI